MTWRAHTPLQPFDDDPALISTASARALGRASKVVLAIVAVAALAAAALAVAPLVGIQISTSDGVSLARGRTVAGPVSDVASLPLHAPGLVLPPTTCTLPDLGSTPEQASEHAAAVVACLDTAWAAAFAERGLEHSTPRVDFAADTDGGACGAADVDDAAGWYCGGNRTLYLPVDRLPDGSRAGHIALVAHEYAHHVQLLGGVQPMLTGKRAYLTPRSDEWLELSRRNELQANCFAGMFLAAAAEHGDIPRSVAYEAVADFGWSVTSDTHGTAGNQAYWARLGYLNGSIEHCITWAVDGAMVT